MFEPPVSREAPSLALEFGGHGREVGGATEKHRRVERDEQVCLQLSVAGPCWYDGRSDGSQSSVKRESGRYKMVAPCVQREIAPSDSGRREQHVHSTTRMIVPKRRLKNRPRRDIDVAPVP